MRPGFASAVFAVLAFAWTAAAETLVVGPGERFAKPSQAARAAKAGDTVLILKGVYVDVATWDTERLTIRGEEGAYPGTDFVNERNVFEDRRGAR